MADQPKRVASRAALQALVFHDAADLAFILLTDDNFKFDATSTAVHDGSLVIKPDNVLTVNPGRWLRVQLEAEDLTIPLASETVAGKVELATNTETAAGLALQANDSRLPTQDENDALQGTDGIPSDTNRYVTDSDPRLSGGGGVTGTGVAGEIAFFDGVSSITSSANLTFDGSDLSILGGGTLFIANVAGNAGNVLYTDVAGGLLADGEFNWDAGTRTLALGAASSAFLILADPASRIGVGIGAPTEALHIVGNAIIDGKLTVTGAIDPTALLLAGADNEVFVEFSDGDNVAVSPADKGRIIFNQATQKFQVSENGAAYVDMVGAGSFTPPLGADEGGTGVDMTAAYAYLTPGLVYYDPVSELMNTTASIEPTSAVDGIEIKNDLRFMAKDHGLPAKGGRVQLQLWDGLGTENCLSLGVGVLTAETSRFITASNHLGTEVFYLSMVNANSPFFNMYLNGSFLAKANFTDGTEIIDWIRFEDVNGNPQFRVFDNGAIKDASWKGQVIDPAFGGTGAGAFTQGSVVFAGASGTYSEDNAGLFYDATNNNLGLNLNTFGTNAAGVLALGNGATEVSAAVADTVQLYSVDLAAGNTTLGIFTEGSGALLTGQADSVSANRLKVKVNGTVVELLAV